MIRVLDSFIADKIAAGEVIERPVSAIKELVENSIDAGASSIIVEIRGGGKSYIRVTDDGCGIPSEEAETAFLRHATSKISSVTDLDNITSLGFRGEALASISAVSRLTMVTRTADSDMGIKLVLHGGQVVSNERIGANIGTTVIAEDLFYNTPARRKFMKSDAREASAIIELIQQLAVCYSDIRFMMINNGQTLFSTSGKGDLLEVVTSLYPDFRSAELIPVEGVKVSGLVSDPGSTRNSRKGQLFFVNGRLVSSDVIEKALVDGYRGRIFSGYPVAILFIEQEPADIDVNIHPGKREIRFLRNDEVRRAITEAVDEAVNTEAGIPQTIIREEPAPREVAGDAMQEVKPVQTSVRDYLNNNYSETAKTEPEYDINPTEISSFSVGDEMHTYGAKEPFDFSELSLKGYVFDTYIIMQGRDTLYIFDQHAAHERIFYEKFLRGYRSSAHVPQPVLTPFTLNVSPDIYSSDRAWLDTMKSFGYDIEDFGDNTFMVRGIPSYMTAGEAESFARGYIDAIGEERSFNSTVVDKLIMRSCKSAVKAHDRLSELEIKELMAELSKCDDPYACPHGRPTFIKMTAYDIERSFRRR